MSSYFIGLKLAMTDLLQVGTATSCKDILSAYMVTMLANIYRASKQANQH